MNVLELVKVSPAPRPVKHWSGTPPVMWGLFPVPSSTQTWTKVCARPDFVSWAVPWIWETEGEGMSELKTGSTTFVTGADMSMRKQRTLYSLGATPAQPAVGWVESSTLGFHEPSPLTPASRPRMLIMYAWPS